MKVIIKGNTLKVVKTTRVLVEWQNQSGKTMPWLGTDEGKAYGLAFMAFCAMQNAGMEPNWDKLLDVDTDEWKFIKEPSDDRRAGEEPVPPSSLAASEEGADEGASTPAPPASKPSKKPKGGSKSK
jgi:hypothetical protein